SFSQKRHTAPFGLRRSQKRNTSDAAAREGSRRGDAVRDRIDWPAKVFAGRARRARHCPRTHRKGVKVRPLRTLAVSVVAILALTIPSAAFGRALIIGGSTSVLPLAQKLAAAYHKATHQPTPKVTGGQSDIGISGVAEGRFDIGDSSRDPIEGVDPHGLTFVRIARDGVCVVTNKANPIANMSTSTVEEIFTGQKRDWSEVPGAKVSGPIEVFDRDGASGTQDAFQHIFLEENRKITSSATAKTSNGL